MGRKPQRRHPDAAVPSRAPRDPGLVLLTCGVALGGIGVSVAMAPGGYNPFGPVKALVLLLSAALVFAGLATGPRRMRAAFGRSLRDPVAWLARALVVVAALATLLAVDRSQSILGHYPEYQGLLLLAASAIVGIGAYALAGDGRSWTWIGRAAAVAVLVVSAYAFVQAAGLDPVPSLLEFTVRRVRSTLGNASNLGVFLVFALPLVLARARAEHALWRVASWGALAAGAVVVVLSLSRGAWAGAIAASFVWVLVEGRRWKLARLLKVAGIAAATLAAVVVLAVAFVPNAGSRLSDATDPSAGTAAWRVEVWTISSRMVAARPLLGYGPGSFRYAFPALRTASTMVGEGGAQVLEDPHNVFASAAIAAGIPGLLAFLALVVFALRAAWRLEDDVARPHAGPALACALAGGLVALQFHFFTLDTAPLFAVLLGLAAGGSAPSTAPASSEPRIDALVRAGAGAAAVIFVAGALFAAGLVAADRRVAAGYGAVQAEAPWPQARAEFEAAHSLAPWEPAIEWALGRGATQWVSRTGDASAFPDAEAAMLSTVWRLPADPLALAQTAEAYLVGGLASRDSARIRQALAYSQEAIAKDPENGYRWETKGTALAALGDVNGAVDALSKAVQYSPGDGQAWSTLATVYRRIGDAAKAADAQSHADALAATGAAGQ